jgi:hypothetical protein
MAVWTALLVYSYFLICLSQWVVKWIGMVPSESRLSSLGYASLFPEFATHLDLWLQFFAIGPMALFISPCGKSKESHSVCLKKNRRGFSAFGKWIALW